MAEKKGVIYILTNPSFPEYVKIGYADDIKKRLDQLNRSECIPFAFRVYATYEVDNRLSDKGVHSIIDKLNPTLRSIDNFNGKERVREFYAMDAEDAYAILEAMAEIHGCKDRLKLITPNEQEIKDEETADIIETERQDRQERFSFEKCNIPIGSTLTFCNDDTITCIVADERMVIYQGVKMSLTGLAKKLLGKKQGIAGPRYFKYNGEFLNDIRTRLGV